MKYSESSQYRDMLERLRSVDLRSPYYALASSDLKALDAAYRETDAALDLANSARDALVVALEQEQESNTLMQLAVAAAQSQAAEVSAQLATASAQIATLEARVAELEAQVAGSAPPAEQPLTP